MSVETKLILNKGLIIEYAHLREDCLAEAEEIASSATGRKGRSKDRHLEDALNGLMLQYAVAEYFISRDVDVGLSDALIADFSFNDIFIDVKGRFHKSSTCYTQSDWEHLTANQLNINLIYLCFDCRNGQAIFEGGISKEQINRKSNYSGWMIFPNQLKNFEFIIGV